MPRNKSEVEIIIDSKFKDRGFKDAARDLDTFDIAIGNLVAGGLSTFAGLALDAGSALLEWGKNAADAGSDLLETESLLTNALGPAYDRFEERVNAVSDATGLSANNFKQALSPILAMTKAQGFAADEAGRVSVAFGQAAVDLNSYFNSTTGFEDLQSALAGSSETLQKYGINANVAALQQEALRIGLVDTLGPLDQAQRTTALLSLVQSQAADAMGDAARTADGFANTQRSTNQAIQDANAVIGTGITEAWQPWQKLINEFATEDLPGYAKAVSEAAKLTGVASRGIIESRKQAAEQESLLGDAVERTLRQLGLRSGVGTAILANQFSEYLEIGQEVVALEEELAHAATLTGGAFDARQEAFQKGFAGSEFFREPIEEANHYIDRMSVVEQVTTNASSALGEFSGADLNAFFGGAAESASTLSEELNNSVDTVQNLITKSAEFSAADFFNTTVDNTSFLEEAANALANAGGSLDLSLNLLTDSGTPLSEVQDIATELIGDRSLDILSDALSGGLIDSEEFDARVRLIDESLGTLEDPISVVSTGISELVGGLDQLNGTYTSAIGFEFDGLETLREARDLVVFLTNADIPDIDTELSEFGPDSEASTANRRR